MRSGDTVRAWGGLWCIALLVLLLQGCTASHTDIDFVHEEGFTRQALIAGGLAVGGMVSAVERLDEEERVRYAERLGERIAGKYPDLEMHTAEELQGILGRYYHEVVDEYRRTGGLTRGTLATLGKRIAVARYIALARIVENIVTENRSEYPEEAPEAYELLKDPSSTSREGTDDSLYVTVWVELSTTRKMTVEMAIYDLRRRSRVLSGSIHESVTRHVKHGRRERKDRHEKLLNTVAQRAVGVVMKSMMQPAAPDEAELLDRVFSGFAEKLVQ